MLDMKFQKINQIKLGLLYQKWNLCGWLHVTYF